MPSRRRRKEITVYDVAKTPVQHLDAEENTKAIYKWYMTVMMTPVFEFAQKKGWTSQKYWQAIHSREPLTELYVSKNKIKPICSSQKLEIFFTEHMDKYASCLGPGPVSQFLVELSLKAWQSSINLYGLQTITWRQPINLFWLITSLLWLVQLHTGSVPFRDWNFATWTAKLLDPSLKECTKFLLPTPGWGRHRQSRRQTVSLTSSHAACQTQTSFFVVLLPQLTARQVRLSP